MVIEHDSRTPNARIGDEGIFDGIFDERIHAPEEIHLAMFGAVGLSNGAVFWSKDIRRELAIRVETLPTLEEYLRTRLVAEPVYICREKLAIWAENEQSTTRNAGLGKGWLDAGNPVRGATHLGRCGVLDPQYSAAWKLLGKAWLASGQPQAAREAWQRGLSVAGSKGDQQARKEMQVFLRRLDREQAEPAKAG